MHHIGDIARERIERIEQERNIELASRERLLRGGFTQVPNAILVDSELSLGAKVTYSLFLKFYWDNNAVFPGQKTLAAYMGMSVSRANEYVKELEKAGLIEIKRLGQGRTNRYRLNSVVKKGVVHRSRKS